jgi:ATP-binding cassette, subfamily B, bacterial
VNRIPRPDRRDRELPRDDRTTTAAKTGVVRVLVSATAIYFRAAPVAACLRAATAVLAGVAPVLTAWLTKSLLDRLTGHGGPSIWVCVAGMAVGGATVAVAQHVSRYADSEIGRRVARHTQTELFTAVSRHQGMAELEDPVFQDRVRLAQQAIQSGPQQLTNSVLTVMQSSITVVAFLGTLAAASPLMTALVAASVLPTLAAQLRLSRRRVDAVVRNSPRLRRQIFYSTLLMDARAGKEIRLFGLGRMFRDRMLTEVTAAQASERAVDRATLRVDGLLSLLTAGVSAAALMTAVTRVSGGHGTIGDISVLMAALAGVQNGLAGVVAQLATANQMLIMFGNFIAVTRDAGSFDDRPGIAVEPLHTGIELHDVWFRYRPDHDWILRGVNLTIPQGRSVALVGLNGAGKSTLVKLLCRLYEPTRGSITWDGVDIRDIDVASLRTRIGVVFQDFMAYELSVADNIVVGDLSAVGDESRLREAARGAGADAMIDLLPRGFQTMLSRIFASENAETGVVLSGGQWQRLAIARAVLRSHADLLILDEPSSGLDAVAEGEIQESLRRLREGRSSLLISHRLNTVRNADWIVVLGGGVIVEQGTHDALMDAEGDYATLFRIQAGGFQLSTSRRAAAVHD